MTATSGKRQFCAYLRVSDEAGREGSTFHSPEDQRTAIQRVVTALYDGEVAREFEDMSLTGRVMARPGLVQAVAWVMEDPTSRGIATLNVSRLARNTKGIIELVLETLVPAGAAFVSAEQMIDTSKAYGRKQLRDLASDAEAQSDMIGETWSRVLAKRAGRGDHPTGKQVYGYRREPDPADPKARVLVPDEEGGTAEVVRRMYRLYNGGTGLREIARLLNAEGVASPGGSTWGTSTVKRTLESEAYVGRLVFKGRTVTDDDGRPVAARWEPLVSEEVWETFQSEKRRRSTVPSKVATPKWTLGGGLSVCGKCGGRLTVNSLAKPDGMVMCSTYRAGRVCDGVFMLRYKFDGLFTVALWAYWQDEAALAASAKHDEQAARAREEAEAEVRRCEDRLAVIEQARKRLRKQNAEGLTTDDELRSDLTDYAVEAAGLRAAISDARERVASSSSVGDAYQRLMTDFSTELGDDGEVRLAADTDDLAEAVSNGTQSMSVAEWSRALSKVVQRVELHDDKVVFVPTLGEPRTVKREKPGKGPNPRKGPQKGAAPAVDPVHADSEQSA